MQKFKKKISKKNFYFLFKNLLDFIFAFIFLILGSPLIILISLLIKFSSRGPIFYKQKRIGKNKKTFKCLKFRTMFPESEDMLQNLLSRNKELRIEYQKDFKLKNDPRITPIGEFLRKSSLDEIPQFLNVLKGEMSIVGPRPIVKKEVSKYGNSFKKAFSLRPGITGLWQVSGRNNLSYKKRVELDLIYAKDVSMVMDLRIIIRTIGVILFPKDRGAY